MNKLSKLSKIAVLNSTHIGTALCTFPLLSRIQKKYKNAEITVILSKRNGVLKKFLLERGFRVIVLENNFTGLGRYQCIVKAWLGKYGKYDLAICGLEPRKTDHLFLWTISRNSIAYAEDNWHGRLITKPKKFDIKQLEKIHESQFQANVFDASLICSSEWPRANIPKIYHQKIKLLIQSENNRENSLLPVTKMAEVLNSGFAKVPFELIISSSHPNQYGKELENLLSFKDVSIKYTESFEDFLQLVNSSDLVLVGDGGASHIAAFVGTPSIILFGHTNPVHWRPMAENVSILYDSISVANIRSEDITNILIKKLLEIKNKLESVL